MVLTPFAKERILTLYGNGFMAPTIHRILQREGIRVSRVGIWKFLQVYKATGSILRREGSGMPSKIIDAVKLFIDEQMQKDDETTAYQIRKLLMRGKGINISTSAIVRCRKNLGWTYRGSSYCQLIRNSNKEKRLEWAKQWLHEAEYGFMDVIWSDESSVQIETHKRHCYRKKGCPPKSKPRYYYLICTIMLNYIMLLKLPVILSSNFLFGLYLYY